MIRTRDLAVGTGLFLFIALIVSARAPLGSLMTHGQFASVGDAFAPGIASDEPLTVTISGETKDPSIRERLIAKLGKRTQEDVDVPAVETPPVEDVAEDRDDVSLENGVIEGGRVLGDGRMSTRPQVGFVYACAAPLRGVGEEKGWIHNGVWYPELKPAGGAAPTLSGVLTETTGEGARMLTSTAVSANQFSLSVPLDPIIAPAPYCVMSGPVGVARDGVPIYAGQNPFGEDAVAHEMLDVCAGSNSEGRYHYYAESPCLTAKFDEGAPNTLLGYALDGFGIFAQNENGILVTNSDLDGCHGHAHAIPWNGEMVTMYHYHFTDEFPYSVGCFMGTPASPF